jgi:hypothetical protein
MRVAMPFAAACAVAMLSAAGCGDTVVPPTTGGAPPPDAAPKVAPNVPKAAQAPSPVPGQANDHSSPAFKDGGKNDPSK